MGRIKNKKKIKIGSKGLKYKVNFHINRSCK